MKTAIEEILLNEGKTLLVWLSENSYIDESKIQVIRNMPDSMAIQIYTNDHYYRINAKETYLGCTSSTRRNRPGETWNRGSDLADGPFTKDTFHKIMGDIVGYELKKIALPVEQDVKPPATEESVNVVNTVVINQAPEE